MAVISNPYNSNTGSISITLNKDQVGPSAIPQAHSHPLFTSPAHIQTDLIASSPNLFTNSSNSPAKKHSSKHNPYTKIQPHPHSSKKLLDLTYLTKFPHEALNPPQNFSLIKKRNCINNDQPPTKKVLDLLFIIPCSLMLWTPFLLTPKSPSQTTLTLASTIPPNTFSKLLDQESNPWPKSLKQNPSRM